MSSLTRATTSHQLRTWALRAGITSRPPQSATAPSAEPAFFCTSDTLNPMHTFTAELWLWDARRSDTWTFVTVPTDVTAAIEDAADALGPRAGFGR